MLYVPLEIEADQVALISVEKTDTSANLAEKMSLAQL